MLQAFYPTKKALKESIGKPLIYKETTDTYALTGFVLPHC